MTQSAYHLIQALFANDRRQCARHVLTDHIGLLKVSDLSLGQHSAGQSHAQTSKVQLPRHYSQRLLQSLDTQHRAPGLLTCQGILLQTGRGALFSQRRKRRANLVISHLRVTRCIGQGIALRRHCLGLLMQARRSAVQ
ncbi:hypothetical protein D3C77_625970 [compost metagenome]